MDCDVLLIDAPWSRINAPSVQLSTLKPNVQRVGFECHVLYANLRLAALIGPELYWRFVWAPPSFPIPRVFLAQNFLGEWLFSDAVFGSTKSPGCETGFLDHVNQRALREATELLSAPGFSDFLEEVFGHGYAESIGEVRRKTIPTYLSQCCQAVGEHGASVVGFTSTFNQNMPSLALAKTIKEKNPEKLIVFGGANCGGVMGPALLRAFPFVDYVVSGEGEETFPSLLKTLKEGEAEGMKSIRGLSYREGKEVQVNPPAELIKDLGHYPMMDCDDYYEQLAKLQASGNIVTEHGKDVFRAGKIFLECSRGCWWGQVSHCTFCGLNGPHMKFRAKSSERIINELVTLSKKYKVLNFEPTDNILNPAYIVNLFPKLRALGLDFQFYFEVRANMTKKQIKTLAECGVTRVQPGIESLSTHVLQLMKKGTDVLNNIQCLKWCEEFKISAEWNLLVGFPGETEEDYLTTERRIPLLAHFPPPQDGQVSRIELHRFSPHFDFSAEFGFENVRPLSYYKYVYDFESQGSEGDDTLGDIAYFFDYDLDGFEEFLPHIKQINRLVGVWCEKYRKKHAKLVYLRGPDFINIIDERFDFPEEFSLSGLAMEVLLSCDRVASLNETLATIRRRKIQASSDDVFSSLAELVERNLVVEENGRYISLVTAERPTEVGFDLN